MYAILQQGGRQYRVAPGDRLLVDRLTADVGTFVSLEPVLVLQNDEGTTLGTPVVDGVRVAAMVVSHRRGAKLRVFKYKPKKRYRRTRGHRSQLTELRVEALLAKGEPLPTATPAAADAAEAAPQKPSRRAAAATKAETAAETPAAEATPHPAGRGRARAAEAQTDEAQPTSRRRTRKADKTDAAGEET